MLKVGITGGIGTGKSTVSKMFAAKGIAVYDSDLRAKTIMLDKTTIIISHRISSVKLAKKILVMDEGKVIEEGNHQDLLKKRGEYYKIYKNQIEEEDLITFGYQKIYFH